jgi:hypothetical protein
VKVLRFSDLTPEQADGLLGFIADALPAWRGMRRVGCVGIADEIRRHVRAAVRIEKSRRLQRVRDRLLRDIRDPREI